MRGKKLGHGLARINLNKLSAKIRLIRVCPRPIFLFSFELPEENQLISSAKARENSSFQKFSDA